LSLWKITKAQKHPLFYSEIGTVHIKGKKTQKNMQIA